MQDMTVVSLDLEFYSYELEQPCALLTFCTAQLGQKRQGVYSPPPSKTWTIPMKARPRAHNLVADLQILQTSDYDKYIYIYI